MGGREGPKEIFTSVPPLPAERFSAEGIRALFLPLPELLVCVVVVMFTVLFPPEGLVILTVRPPESLLVISEAIDALLAESPGRAHTFRFLPVFVAVVVEPATAPPAISRDDEEFCPLLLLLLLLLYIIYTAELEQGSIHAINYVWTLVDSVYRTFRCFSLDSESAFPKLILFKMMELVRVTSVALLARSRFTFLLYPWLCLLCSIRQYRTVSFQT